MRDPVEELEELRDREMQRLSDCVATLTEGQVNLRVSVGRLEVKSGVWGFLAGLLPSIAVLIYFILKMQK